MKRLMLLAVLVLILSSSSFATVFVKWDSTYNGPGNDWDHAYHSVQAGINASGPGGEVWVAGDSDHPYFERIALLGGVGLYGGFAGRETSRNERDPAANVTVLDGQALGSVVSTLQPTPSGFTAVIDGFTIRNGKAYAGGGIYFTGGSPTISNNIICSGTATVGGGIYCSGASPTISNNVICDNFVGDGYLPGCGGGIYAINSSPIIVHNVVIRNVAHTDGLDSVHPRSCGGGVYCSGGSPQISFNSFRYNTADTRGTVYFAVGNGGAIYLKEVDDTATVANNTIIANSATHGAGCGIYVSDCSPAIVSNTIVHNGGGEAIYCSGSSSSISNNVVAFNTGGATCSGVLTPALRNNCIHNPDGHNYSGLSAGAGDISVDPKLIAPEFGEIHLQAGSPCIGAGWNDAPGLTSLDTDGDARILPGAGVTDIGADEYNGTQPPFNSIIVRVSPSGDDTDGSTWAHAKQTVAGGIALASVQGGEVWVAAGTYNERVTLATYVYLYGGFAGTESQRSERDWMQNECILDGQAGGSVVTAQSITGYRTCCVDGFTIRNGTGTQLSFGLFGGGICVYRACPFIAHNVIGGNTAEWGGGIGLVTSCVLISDNTIVNNTAGGYGGGIEGSLMSDATICRNLIAQNTATQGGGICYYGNGSYTIADNVIRQNTAVAGGGLQTMWGINPDYHNLFNNLFYANTATSTGGGVYADVSNLLACNNTFYGNTAAHSPPLGGAVLAGGGTWCSNILAFNSSGVYRLRPLVWRNNDVYGSTDIWNGHPADYVNMPNQTGMNGNISVDPLFLAPLTGDFHLSAGSPCIDVGSDSDAPAWPDLDGKTRIFGDHVDMGCFEWRPVIEATLDIKPDTLNPKSKGQYITAYIEMPAGEWSLDDIDVSSLRINGVIGAAEHQPQIGDYDSDGLPDLMVKFDREALCNLLSPGEQTVTLTGSCLDGADLTGQDTIRVLGK
ncbi:MAG TPA: right-handed parallel beta-helix repeat-containing protein [Armatimonadota bacterium]|nr:right-handed parallel beta-helix repeat-containing protein [Armatimonadota bacterium]